MREFFRHCPECGRRFHIKLVSKKLVNEKMVSIPTKQIISSQYRYPGGRYSGGGIISGPPTVVIEGKPVIVDVEDFQYLYKCSHCGHEWAEKRTEEHKEGRSQ